MPRPRAFILLAILAAAAAAPGDELLRFAFEKAEMGVPFRITLYTSDENAARAAAEAAFARVEQLNAVFSDYEPDSELSRLSQTAGQGSAVTVSDDLWRVLDRAQALAARSDGAFDITAGPLVNAWRRARRKQELPSAELIDQLRERVGWKKLRLDPAKNTAELLVAEMRLDLGGIAKGDAADAALAVLRARGIGRALVAASGDIVAGDAPPGEPGWRVEVATLDAPGAPPALVLHLANQAISSSGDLFQRVEVGGKRYSHIIDPRTGNPLTDHSLVTVVARDGATADSLATAVSVLGPERGLALIEETPGVAARILRHTTGTVEARRSRRWE